MAALLAGCGGGDHGPQLPTAPVDARGDALTGIFTVRPDGSGLRRLHPSGAEPTWGPNEQQITFVVGFDIWVLDVREGKARKLIDDGAEPAWSPDGARIAYVREAQIKDGYVRDRGIFLANADGTNVRRITAAFDGAPAWSPDGKRLVFLRERPLLGDVEGIYVVEQDGTELKRIGNGDGHPGRPTWSHDGKSIAVARDDGVFVLHPDGSGMHRVTNESLTGEKIASEPSWSPDGSMLAVGADDEIYVVSTQTGEARRVTDSGVASCWSESICLSWTVDTSPAWSPKGKLIVFARELTSSLP